MDNVLGPGPPPPFQDRSSGSPCSQTGGERSCGRLLSTESLHLKALSTPEPLNQGPLTPWGQPIFSDRSSPTLSTALKGNLAPGLSMASVVAQRSSPLPHPFLGFPPLTGVHPEGAPQCPAHKAQSPGEPGVSRAPSKH